MHFKFTAFGVRFQFIRHANIAFAVGGVFEQLTEVIAVTFRRFDL